MSDEFFAVLHFVEAGEEEDGGGEEDEEAVVEEGVVEDFGVFVEWDVEGVEEDVPFADAEDAVDGEEDHADDDEEDGGAVAVADDGAEHEAEHADEEGGDEYLEGEVEGRDFDDEPVGEGRQYEGEEEADEVGDEEAEEPYLVAVVGDTEDDFYDFGVLVVLDAEAGGVEDEEDGGDEEHAVAGCHGDFGVGEEGDADGDEVESDGAEGEVQEFVPEYDFDIIPGEVEERGVYGDVFFHDVMICSWFSSLTLRSSQR